MKKLTILIVTTTLLFSTQSHAQDWLDSLKSIFGLTEEQAEQNPLNVTDMVKRVTDNLGIQQQQAEGGLGAIFDYAKNNLNTEQFNQLSESLPGLGELINSAPNVSELQSAEGLSGLMDKAAQYNESLKAINDVKKQFEALGLKPEMILQFVEQAKSYLDTEQGQQAKQILTQGVGKLLG